METRLGLFRMAGSDDGLMLSLAFNFEAFKTSKEMNRWKIAFWCCFSILLVVSAWGAYSIIDQGVTLTYLREEYTDTENDLHNLSVLINETDLSKAQIQKALSEHKLYEFMDFKSDTVSLERVLLIFRDDQLVKIEKQ